MNTQLFPDSCGWEVAEAWCPMTDLRTYIIVLIVSAIIMGVGYLVSKILWLYYNSQKRKRIKNGKPNKFK